VTVSYSYVDVEDIPYHWGTFKFVRHHLGATAFGFAQIDFPADKVGSEHDEAESGQEEVYLCLSGSGTLEIDGETIDLKPGRYVLVSPEAKRRPTAGADGMSFLVIGGVPGGVYEPWELPAD
jgi:quercetin dioxygenase-like cupin family protein